MYVLGLTVHNNWGAMHENISAYKVIFALSNQTNSLRMW
jgi:hypothetical protein